MGSRAAFPIRELGTEEGEKKFSMIISGEGEEMENRLGKEAWLSASRNLISSGLSWGLLLLVALIFTTPLDALGNGTQQLVK